MFNFNPSDPSVHSMDKNVSLSESPVLIRAKQDALLFSANWRPAPRGRFGPLPRVQSTLVRSLQRLSGLTGRFRFSFCPAAGASSSPTSKSPARTKNVLLSISPVVVGAE